MCGIAGAFAYHTDANAPSTFEVTRVTDAMANRGPDGSGLWSSPDHRTILAHRRLAIIDLSEAGAQPMVTTDGQVALVFNGEIYNYKALKAQCESRGHRFHSSSDTEVILALYRDFGPDLINHLRGMFAIALWDEARQGLLLARDPFGIKPLYVADDGKILRFASQVKALLAGGGVGTAPSEAGIAGFYLTGFVPEPFTTYQSIRALPAGHSQWIDRQGVRAPMAHFQLSSLLADCEEAALAQPFPQTRVEAHLREALLDTVEHHMVADVPVGIFLSAGRDSSTLVSLAKGLGVKDLRTLTLGFREYRGTADDETELAELVSGWFGTTHQTRWISRDIFRQALPQAFEAMDQPSVDGLNTYFVCKLAAESGLKVALSGLGGDELFGGYPSFSEVPRLARLAAPFTGLPLLPRAFRSLLLPLTGRRISPKWAGLFEYGAPLPSTFFLRRALFMPWELPDLANAQGIQQGIEELDLPQRMSDTIRGLRSDRARIMALEMTWFMGNQLLKDSDWASMAHGVELRVPLVDPYLLKRIGPLLLGPNPASKDQLVGAAPLPLPPAILNRPKSGFSMPLQAWAEDVSKEAQGQRGRRGWAKLVAQRLVPGADHDHHRVMLLTTDGFGGHGGIALYIRDLLSSVARLSNVSEVVGLPRVMPLPAEPIPRKVLWDVRSLGSKITYLTTVLKHLLSGPQFGLVVSGVCNFAPLALLVAWLHGSKKILLIYGVDAWTRHPNWLVRWAIRKMDAVISISKITLDRFQSWAHLPPERCHLLPNAIHLDDYCPGPKSQELLSRYNIPPDATVLMTLGRMAAFERYKGFDEVIEVMDELRKQNPKVIYLAIGDGTDLPRLKEKAKRLGIQECVIFTGRIAESEKAEHYRLADAFVMPSRGEGFGFVLLEAMACGIPVVGSCLDGTREAVRNGELGVLVDPDDSTNILKGIQAALRRERGVPDGLTYFSLPAFQSRCEAILSSLLPVKDA